MHSKGKIGIGILVVVIVIGSALAFSGKSSFFAGRFGDRDARGGRGGGDGRGGDRGSYGRGGGSDGGPVTQEIGPDLAVLTIEPSYVTYEPKPGVSAHYYRSNVKFKNLEGPAGNKLPAKFDWTVLLNDQKYTKLALNELSPTWPYYAFDILESVACPSFNVFAPKIRVELDPYNKFAETNENNNNIPASFGVGGVGPFAPTVCHPKQLLRRCDMAILVTQNFPGQPTQPGQSIPTFKDIDPIKDPACAKAAGKLVAQGFIQADPDGTFGGYGLVDRTYPVKLLIQYGLGANIPIPTPGVTSPYPDLDMKEWYAPWVYWLFNEAKFQGKADLVGYTDGTYKPWNNVDVDWFKAMIQIVKNAKK